MDIIQDVNDFANWATRKSASSGKNKKKKKRQPKKIKKEKRFKVKKKPKDTRSVKQKVKDEVKDTKRRIGKAKNKVKAKAKAFKDGAKAKAKAAKESVKRGLSKGKQKIMNKKLIGLFLSDDKADTKLNKNIKAAREKMEKNKIYHMITSEKAQNKPELTDKKAIKKYTTKLSKERKRFLKLHRTWVKNLRRLGKLNRKRDIVPTPDQAKVLGPKKLYEDMSDSEYETFNDSEIEEWTEYEYDSDDYSSEDEYEEYNVNLKF